MSDKFLSRPDLEEQIEKGVEMNERSTQFENIKEFIKDTDTESIEGENFIFDI